MLYQLGVLTIKVAPFNVDRVKRTSQTSFVSKPVLGRPMPQEYVGEGDTTFVLSGKLFPKKIGGLTELALLHAMRQSGYPQFMLRGDGAPFGWVVVTKVDEDDQFLSSDGVGQLKTVGIELKTANPPGLGFLFTVIGGLLG